MRCALFFVASAVALALVSAMGSRAAVTQDLAAAPNQVLAREARALLAARCFACHGPDAHARKAELRLDTPAGLFEVRGSERPFEPGDRARSLVWQRICDSTDPMPPSGAGPALDDGERALLGAWIDVGAPFAPHWAFAAPTRTDAPDVRWPRDPKSCDAIDAWVLFELRARGLEPSSDADRRVLLRRVSLDLVGLPPSPEFLARYGDGSDNASYEAAVDELLNSPNFGERWASVWLDLARYADSAGYGSDPLRTIWPYRDWVVDALDANMPFDRFTVLQLAGDLVPDASDETRLATAFHRNTLNNTEGGTDDEEFRIAAVKDRVDTTMQVWTGLTAGCARCHDHKFDPLSQREYYELFALFDQTQDADRDDEAPLLDTPTKAEREHRADLEARVERLGGVLGERVALLERDAPLASAASRTTFFGDERRVEPVAVTTTRFELGAQVPAVLVLDVLPGASGTVGHSRGNGNAVLSDVHLVAHGARMGREPVARLRIELPGRDRILSLAEVELTARDGMPVTGGRARQSSTDYDRAAELARDGNRSGRFDDGSVTHTRTEDDPWWELELEAPTVIASIAVHNRTDGALSKRLAGAHIVLFDVAGAELGRLVLADAEAARAEVVLGAALSLPLVAAAADFEQRDNSARDALDADNHSGWGLAPRVREAHRLVLLTGAVPAAERFELVLEQNFGDNHVFAEMALHGFDDLVVALAGKPQLPVAERARLLAAVDVEIESALGEQRAAQAELATLTTTRTPVLVELPPDRRRVTHVEVRGNFRDRGDVVGPGVPAALDIEGRKEPANRLELAQWLVDPRYPLTARVTVNRFWSRLFGRGLVASEEDFGLRGGAPSHPELLDTLARDFVASGWDVKALLRRITTSHTYRQSSAADRGRLARDPSNTWLSRGPRQRLEAEMVRDSALMVAGLLSDKRGGPPVFPPQPDGLWRAAFNGQRSWETSMGEDRYRRDIYTFLRRTIPYHTRTTFDGTSRETCTLRRGPTNTPLQALVTLNDPVFVECAQALGRRILACGVGRVGAAEIAFGVQLALSRDGSDEELRVLLELSDVARAAFAKSVDDAVTFATDPLGPLPGALDPVEAAVATLIANTLFNLDDFLTRE